VSGKDRLDTDIVFGIVPIWVLDHPDLSDRAVRIYGILSQKANNDTLQTWPSRHWIKDRVHCSIASVDRALSELAAAGAITRTQRRDENGFPTSTLYTVVRTPPLLSPVIAATVTGDSLSRPIDLDQTYAESISEKNLDVWDMSKPSKQKHDAMWDALVAEFGRPLGAMRARFHDAAVTFCRADVPPEAIGPAARRYRSAWPDVDCNPQALAKHWHRFGPQEPVERTMVCSWAEATDDRGQYCLGHKLFESEHDLTAVT